MNLLTIWVRSTFFMVFYHPSIGLGFELFNHNTILNIQFLCIHFSIYYSKDNYYMEQSEDKTYELQSYYAIEGYNNKLLYKSKPVIKLDYVTDTKTYI